MTPQDRATMAEYFDRRDRSEPSGWWIVPALIVPGFAYAGIVAWWPA